MNLFDINMVFIFDFILAKKDKDPWIIWKNFKLHMI